ncbi:hypothetical protein V6N13_082563 [Hibiscus sabdariffa]
MHWKGLWFSFARHGDVVIVYITRKLSRGGKRVGFVRIKEKVDADRAIERLHGFFLYGSRLTVKLANGQRARRVIPEYSPNADRFQKEVSSEWVNKEIGNAKTIGPQRLP